MAAANQLVQRDREVALIEDCLIKALGGSGSGIVFEGKAGLGKTTLIEVGIELARARDMTVLAATCNEGVQPPLAVAADLFAPLVGDASFPDLFEGMAKPALRMFGAVPVAPDRNEAEASPEHLFRLISNVADRGPVLVAVDDVQWVDEATGPFLVHLANRLEDLPVTLLIGLRLNEPNSNPVAGELRAMPVLQRTRLEPFDLRGTRSYLETRGVPEPDEDLVRACWEGTKGNPFFLSEVLRTLEKKDTDPSPQGVRAVIEEGPVADVVHRRLLALGSEAVDLARAALVLAEAATPQRAAAIAGLEIEETTDIAARLIVSDILRVGDTLVFKHPIVRASVANEMDAETEARLRAASAKLLHVERAEPAVVATHLLASPPLGEPWVVETLMAAAKDALPRGAPASAARYLERALDEVAPDDERMARILLDLGEVETRLGAVTAAKRFESALDLIVDPRARASAYLRLGHALTSQDRRVEGAVAFNHGIEVLGDRDEELARRLEAGWVFAAFLEPSLREQLAGRLGRLLARTQTDISPGERVAVAWASVAQTITGTGRDEAVALARRAAGDGDVIREETADGPSFSLLTGTFWAADEPIDSIDLCDVAMEDARTRGSITAFGTVSYCRSWPLLQHGRVLDAVADARQAIEAGRLGWRLYVLSAHAALCHALIESGDLSGAETALESANAVQESPEYALYQEAMGCLRLAQGRNSEALRVSLEAGAIYTGNPFVSHVAFSKWRPVAALAAARLNDCERATELLEEHLSLARAWGAPRSISQGLRAAATIAPSIEEGAVLLEEAFEVMKPSKSFLEMAKVQIELGERRLALGQKNEARQMLADALNTADRSGAIPFVERALSGLVAAGGRPRRLLSSGAASLSPEERRFAQLARQGLTNREIAEALFVTLKSVERRLTSVYKKLGVKSRGELVALPEDLLGTRE